jgi:DNA-binding IscR family transcriptional regulator
MSVGDGAMLLAVQTLVLVARAFKDGTKMPNELEIAEALGCSSVVLKTSLDALQQSGIIMRGDGRDMPLLLMRAADSVSMADIREAVFKKREAMFLGEEISRMYRAFRDGTKAEDVSLQDLIDESA